MQFHVLTIFPEMFASPLSASLLKKAQEKGILSCTVHNLRDYATGKHRTVDDTPYGGGQGMVMKPEPVVAALEGVCQSLSQPWRIFLSPQGKTLTQAKVMELAQRETLVLLCGRYEGVDERIRLFVDEEISIGDYILSGGEMAALVVIDAVARLIPGVVGRQESVADESFSHGLLEYPQYTRPEEFRGILVPEVLLSGHHAEIATWRRQQSLLRTLEQRPDLLATADITEEERRWLEQFKTGKRSQ
ncbi:MAG: tRNA (guanosine(37)-N1)-methyltransferase TrmD [Deltaproteobacteria bacterium]|nr:tRNA (guanosine(37)-N1)-methyltransferase TrmD [Deltaproteobacteria bacterium]